MGAQVVLGPRRGRSTPHPSRQHLIVEAYGVPLAVITTGGNRDDVTQLIPLIQALPPIRGKRGQLLRRPKRLYTDRGYDHEIYRDKVRRSQITPHIARRAPAWACTAGSRYVDPVPLRRPLSSSHNLAGRDLGRVG
ncbi:hypothetical protein CD790_22270 [Streptomyces sp. SAJ15]|nr:hypothetical protein CD790_22270 [Streptomyces sp. SAJ15]